MIQGCVVPAGEGFAQARDAEQLFVGVRRFGDSVAEEDKCVARFEFYARGFVAGPRDQSNWIRTFRKRFSELSAAKKQRRGMAGIDVFEITIAAENAEKHRGVTAHFGMFAKKIVDVVEHTRGVGAHRHAGKSALQHGREQRRAQAFAGDVRDQEGCSVIAHRKHIEVVPADGEARNINAADGEMREILEASREKGLLDVAGDAEFLLEALALTLVFDQARVVQNAGGFDSEGVEDLTVEFGESGSVAGIQIDNAQKIPSFGMNGGFRGAGAMHCVKGNGDDGAEVLSDDTLCILEFDISLSEVLGNHAGLSLESLTQGGLAGSETVWREAQTSAAAGEPDAKRSRRIGLEQETSVRIRDRDRVVQHRAEHGVERKLRMQKHRRFEEKVEFPEAARSGIGVRYALNATENVLNGSVRLSGSENNFVGIVEAKTNDVAIIQYAAIGLLSAYEDAAAVAPVFEIPAVTLGNNCGALPGDAIVGKPEMIPSLAAPNTEGRFGEANKSPRAVGRYDFESSFVDGW
jgi:hypothetical protein